MRILETIAATTGCLFVLAITVWFMLELTA